MFKSQFKYCPFTWIFCSRNTSNRINHFQERALRLVYDDYELTFDELWEKDGSFTIHHYYIQILFRHYIKYTITCHNLFSVSCLDETILPITCGLNLILSFLKWVVFKGSSSISYYGPIICSLVPGKIRYPDSLKRFKSKTRRRKPKNCHCRICKNYTPNVVFLETFR